MLAAAGVLACCFTGADAASQPKSLEQVGPWDMNYDDDGCSLLGNFGAGDDNIIVQFTRFAPGESVHLAFVGKPLASSWPDATITIDFGPPSAPQKVAAMAGTAAGKPLLRPSGSYTFDGRSNERAGDGQAVPFGKPTEYWRDREAAIRWLDLTVPSGRQYRLDLGPMKKPMAAMRQCIDNLVSGWGLDPATQATLSRQALPTNNPENWMRSDDYPNKPLMLGQRAIIEFRLKIDPAGNVTDCAIQRATQGPEFQKVTCALITRRARFAPALDATGKPVASYFISTVRFIIG